MKSAYWLARRGAVILVVLLVGCGDGGGVANTTSEPPMPARGDSAFGVVGNVLVSDQVTTQDASVDQLWVGFSQKDAWEGLVALNARGDRLPFVSGRVVAADDHHLRFYFDPNTTEAPEVVAERLQITLDALKADPEAAEREQPGRWAIAVTVERMVPTEP